MMFRTRERGKHLYHTFLWFFDPCVKGRMQTFFFCSLFLINILMLAVSVPHRPWNACTCYWKRGTPRKETGGQCVSGQPSREPQTMMHSVPTITRSWVVGNLEARPQNQKREGLEVCPFWLWDPIGTVVAAPLVVGKWNAPPPPNWVQPREVARWNRSCK